MFPFPHLAEDWLAIPFYWIRVFWYAITATWQLAVGRPIFSAIGALLLAIGGLVVHRVLWGREAMTEEMRPLVSSTVTVLMGAFLIFVFFLFTAPFRLYDEQRTRTKTAQDERDSLRDANGQLRERIAELERPTPAPPASPTAQARPESDRHPFVSVSSTKVSRNEVSRTIALVIELQNLSVFDVTASVSIDTLLDGALLQSTFMKRNISFPPQGPTPFRYQLSYDIALDEREYEVFLSKSKRLGIRLIAEYPDRGGRTTFTFEGLVDPSLDHINITTAAHEPKT